MLCFQISCLLPPEVTYNHPLFPDPGWHAQCVENTRDKQPDCTGPSEVEDGDELDKVKCLPREVNWNTEYPAEKRKCFEDCVKDASSV